MSSGPNNPSRASIGILRLLALVGLGVAAASSLGFMYFVGRKNPSVILMVLFTVWVLGPFVGLAVAQRRAARWPSRAKTVLYTVMLIVMLGSPAIYGRIAFGPPTPQPAFMFMVVPFASWTLMAVVVLVARNSRANR